RVFQLARQKENKECKLKEIMYKLIQAPGLRDTKNSIHLVNNLKFCSWAKLVQILISEGSLSLLKILGTKSLEEMFTRLVVKEKLKFYAASTGLRVFSTWMASEGNTRDLGSFGEETDEIMDVHQILEEVLLTERGDGHTDEGWNRIKEYVQYQDGIWEYMSLTMNVSSILEAMQPTFRGRLKKACNQISYLETPTREGGLKNPYLICDYYGGSHEDDECKQTNLVEQKSQAKGIGDMLDQHRKELYEQFSQILFTIRKNETPEPEAPTFTITTRSGVSIFDSNVSFEEELVYQRLRKTLTYVLELSSCIYLDDRARGFPAQSNSSSNTIALDSPYLLVLNTEASQSRQHESRKPPTAELFDVDSGRISIRHCEY
nr:hypothetical protein [Tanacetum cinerariifolium]